MRRRGLSEAAMACAAGVSQATVSRALRHSARRTGKARAKLFSYMHQELNREGLAHAEKSEVLKAFERVWGTSEAHAAAIAKVVGALDRLRPSDKEAG
jgi:transcriptional regulator with XRE-family HTH domain